MTVTIVYGNRSKLLGALETVQMVLGLVCSIRTKHKHTIVLNCGTQTQNRAGFVWGEAMESCPSGTETGNLCLLRVGLTVETDRGLLAA